MFGNFLWLIFQFKVDHWENSKILVNICVSIVPIIGNCSQYTYAVTFCPGHFFRNKVIRRKCNFSVTFLYCKCNVISIGNVKQSKSSERISTKPELLVIFSKGHGVCPQACLFHIVKALYMYWVNILNFGSE